MGRSRYASQHVADVMGESDGGLSLNFYKRMVVISMIVMSLDFDNRILHRLSPRVVLQPEHFPLVDEAERFSDDDCVARLLRDVVTSLIGQRLQELSIRRDGSSDDHLVHLPAQVLVALLRRPPPQLLSHLWVALAFLNKGVEPGAGQLIDKTI